MYTDIVQWALIREKVLKRKAPIRQINRETGIHRSTIRKILKHKFPPGHQRSKPTRHSKLGSHLQYIHALLSENEMLPEARRLSIKDIFVSLRKERVYDGGYSTVRDYVRKIGGETRCKSSERS